MIQINFLTGVLILIIAFFIKKYNLTFLIAGYVNVKEEYNKKIDEKKLITYYTNLLINTAFLLFISSLLLYIFPNYDKIIFNLSWILIVIYLIIGVIIFNSTNALLKNKRKNGKYNR